MYKFRVWKIDKNFRSYFISKEKISKNEDLKVNFDRNLSEITDQLSEKDKLFNEYQARKDKITE